MSTFPGQVAKSVISSKIPICPIHYVEMRHDFGSWSVALPKGTAGPGPFFKCDHDGCGLRWGLKHEYFELREGRPKYTKSDSSKRMRCREHHHGCMYIGVIEREANRWTWHCTQCEYSYRDSPGAWGNPPPC